MIASIDGSVGIKAFVDTLGLIEEICGYMEILGIDTDLLIFYYTYNVILK